MVEKSQWVNVGIGREQTWNTYREKNCIPSQHNDTVCVLHILINLWKREKNSCRFLSGAKVKGRFISNSKCRQSSVCMGS